jgi:hypothetical protein
MIFEITQNQNKSCDQSLKFGQDASLFPAGQRWDPKVAFFWAMFDDQNRARLSEPECENLHGFIQLNEGGRKTNYGTDPQYSNIHTLSFPSYSVSKLESGPCTFVWFRRWLLRSGPHFCSPVHEFHTRNHHGHQYQGPIIVSLGPFIQSFAGHWRSLNDRACVCIDVWGVVTNAGFSYGTLETLTCIS